MYKAGISGSDYDKYVERFDNRSTLSKVQQSFYQTKQKILQKIVKREDDFIVAYDAELDAKLELFKSVADTSQRLLCVIEGYQDRVCILAHEESCLGRFLKECGRLNKGLISKMLTASGKTFYYTAQQRIQLRNPLINLYQAVETFQYKAIEDTLITIEQLEKERTAYRASLLWMKSLKLDPESYPELEKYRKVQNHVRKTKEKYDKKKIDVIQKVDMLTASRCNLLSQALAQYQTSWLTFWSNTAYTIASISTCFENCQLSELNEIASLETTQKKPTQSNENSKKKDEENEHDLLNLDEGEEIKEIESDSSRNQTINQDLLDKEIDLINIDDSIDLFSDKDLLSQENTQDHQLRKRQVDDLLTSNANSEDLILLDEILNWSSGDKNDKQDKIDSKFDFLSQFGFDLDKLKNEDKSKPISKNTDVKKEDGLKNKGKKEGKKTNWFDLFADLDEFSQNPKNEKKDC